MFNDIAQCLVDATLIPRAKSPEVSENISVKPNARQYFPWCFLRPTAMPNHSWSEHLFAPRRVIRIGVFSGSGRGWLQSGSALHIFGSAERNDVHVFAALNVHENDYVAVQEPEGHHTLFPICLASILACDRWQIPERFGASKVEAMARKLASRFVSSQTA